jgi:hypothetical protein
MGLVAWPVAGAATPRSLLGSRALALGQALRRLGMGARTLALLIPVDPARSGPGAQNRNIAFASIEPKTSPLC